LYAEAFITIEKRERLAPVDVIAPSVVVVAIKRNRNLKEIQVSDRSLL